MRICGRRVKYICGCVTHIHVPGREFLAVLARFDLVFAEMGVSENQMHQKTPRGLLPEGGRAVTL